MARAVFSEFVRNCELNANQIEYVDMIIQSLCQNGIVAPAQLYDQPFTHINSGELSGLFDADTSTQIVALIRA